MQTRIVAVALIKDTNGRVLLGRKKQDVGPYPNKWHLPGGKVEIGQELLKDCLKREVKEETGLDLLDAKPLLFDEDVTEDKHGIATHYIFLDFECRVGSFCAVPSSDLVTLQWFKKTELEQLDLNKPSLKLFRKIGILD